MSAARRMRRRAKVLEKSRKMRPAFTITTIEGARQSSAHMDPRELTNRYGKHRHDWAYEARSVAGWGIARCRICPSWDIY